jgi:hypothetical protein
VIGRRRKSTPQIYTTVRRAAERYASSAPGITSQHSFSAGTHYDPDNVSFGALVGVDEHVLEGGAGFERHAHRGVAIVTWVVEGALRHEDSTGAAAVVTAGHATVQVAGNGVEHVEENASASEPVRFVQSTFVCDDEVPSYRVAEPPILVAGALFDVHRDGPLIVEAGRVHLYVINGEYLMRRDALYPGDSMRMTPETRMLATQDTTKLLGSGELLVTVLR